MICIQNKGFLWPNTITFFIALIGIILAGFPTSVQSKETSVDQSLYSAVAKGNWVQTTVLLEEYYSSCGLSLNDSLDWMKQSAFSLYNYYATDYMHPTIVVSDYPTKDQTWQYWQTWSPNFVYRQQ
ncbi:MAG: hypothetical protein ACI8ZN_002565 [Bacteroidia bacterium]|jgi:hypothetical protein